MLSFFSPSSLDEEILRGRRLTTRKNNRRRRRQPRLESLETRITPSTDTWTGAVNNLWSNAGNWSGGVPSAGEDLVFPAGVSQLTAANDLAGGQTYNSITIAASGYQLIGNQINLTAGITASYTSGTSLDNMNTTLGGGTISVGTGAELDLGGAFSGTPGLDLTGGGTLAMVGAVGNSYLGTTTVDSGSTLLLEKTLSAIAIPGALTINNGLVQDQAGSQFAVGFPVAVNSPGTLDLNNFSESIGSLSLTGGAVTTGTGVLTLNGNITSNTATSMASVSGNLNLTGATTTISVADPVSLPIDLQISAAISGASAITKTGLGNLQLSGNNSYTGATSITSGTITAVDSNALGAATSNVTVASGAELDLSGGIMVGNPISIAGTGSAGLAALVNASGVNSLTGPITLTGNTTINVSAASLSLGGVIGDGGLGYGITEIGGNTLTLNGSTANTYTGTTTVNAGTLQLNDTGGAAMAGPLVIGDGTHPATVQEGAAGQIGGHAVTINNAATLSLNNFNDSVSSLTMTGSTVTTGTGTLTDSGGVTTNASATTASISGNLALTTATTFSIASGTTASGVDLDISAVVSGAVAVTKTGTGKLELDGANSISGGATITTGEVLVTNGSALGTGSISIASGAELDLSGGITLSSAISVAGAGGPGLAAIVNASGANSLTGAVTLTANTTLNVNAGSLALGGPISGVGFGVTELGGNTLSFNETVANTYTGTTTVSAGTLQLNDTGGAAMAGPLVIGDGTHAATVQEGAAGQIGGQAVTINNAATLNLSNFNDSVSSLTMTGSTVTTGTGTLTDSGGVTTNASATTASISGNLALTSATTFSVASGTTASGVDLDISAVVSGAVAATKTGSGTLELDGANTYSGGTTISAGAVQITNGSALGTGAVSVASGAELDLNFASSSTVLNAFTIAGAGLAGSGVIVNEGAAASLVGTIALSASATLGSSASSLSLDGVVSGTGSGLTFTGGGSFSMGGGSANTYTGATIVDSGTLYLANPAGIISIPGALTVGDGIDTAMVVDDFGGQIVSTSVVTLNAGSSTSSAWISMLGVNETVASLTLTNGGEIDTGTGTLTDSGGLAYSSTSISSVQGLITGNLSLGGNTSTISVAQGHDPSGVDLAISAVIANGGIIKTGVGTMDLTGANTFSTTHSVSLEGGTVTENPQIEVQAGTVLPQSDNALGASSGVVVVETGAMLATSGANLAIPQVLFVEGTGIANQGVVAVLSGTTTFDSTAFGSSNFNIVAASQFGAASGATLNIATPFDDYSQLFNATITNGATGRTIFSAGNVSFGSTITVTQGYFEAANSAALGTAGTAATETIDSGATFELSGGITLDSAKTLVLDGTGASLGGGVSDSKLINLSGSNVISGPVTLGATQTVNVAGGSILTVSGVVSDGGSGYGITQNGLGILDLTANNTFLGNLLIDSGTIQVDGNSTSANPQVMSGGTLAGSGQVGSTLTVASGGTLRPGPVTTTGTNRLLLNNTVLSTGSSVNLVLDGSSAGAYDFLYVNNPANSLALNNATLNVTLGSGYTPVLGSTYTIVFAQNTNGVIGTFNGLANGATFMVGRSAFQINYTSSTVVLTSLGTIDTWVGGGSDTNWMTAGNWQAGVAPSAGDILVFPPAATGASNNNFTAGTNFQSITLDSSTMSFTGNAIVLDNGLTTNYASGSLVFPLGLTLNTNETIQVAGGVIDLSGIVAGAYSITKTGAGGLELDGANTFSGGMSVNAGTVSITNNTALGTGPATVASGAELDVSNNISFLNPLSLAGAGAGGGGALVVQGGSDTASGTITLAANTTIETSAAGSIDFSGLIQGAYGLTFVGSGQTTFSGSSSNTFAGPLDINSGTLNIQMGGNSVLGVAPSATINVGDGTDSATLAVNFANDMLSPTNTVVVNNNAQYHQFAGTATTIGAMTLNGTGYVNLGGSGSSLTASSLTMTGGSVQMLSGALFSTGVVTTNASSSTATITGGTFNLGSSGTTFSVAAGTTSSGVDLNITSVIAGTTALTMSGPGTLELDGANAYSGGTTVSAGSLVITNGLALSTAAATISNGAQLELENGIVVSNAITVTGTGSSGVGAIVSENGSDTLTGAITLGGAVTVGALNTSNLTFSNAIGDGGNHYALTVANAASGLTSFSGANTYTGSTTVASGTLMLGNSNAVSLASAGVTVDTNGSLWLMGGVAIGAVPLTLDGAGGGYQGALASVGSNNSYAGPITLGANVQIEAGPGNVLTLSGAIGDGGLGYGFNSSDSGTVVLTGTSTYTGATVISDGVVRVDGNFTSSSVFDVNLFGTLSGSGTVGSVVSTGGTVAPADGPSVLSTGSFSLNSTSTYSVNLDGASPGNGTTGYDQVVASGAVSLGGALSVAVGGGYTPAPGDQLTIIQNNSGSPVSGTFAGLPEGAALTVGSYTFRITYQGGLSGHNVVLEAIVPTTTQVTTLPQTSTYGQSVTFIAQVTASAGTPTGSVAFYDGNPTSGGVMLGSGTVNFLGQASYSTTTLHATAGTPDQIYAVYAPPPTSAYEPSTSTPFSQTVNPAALIVTANNANMPYGSSALPTFTFSYAGFQNGETASSLTTAPIGAVSTPLSQLHVNSNGYSIVPSGAVDPDYTFTYVTGTLTVTPVLLTITAPSMSSVYGATINLSGATPTYSGFVNGDTAATLAIAPNAPPVLGTSATASSPVQSGGYPITVSGTVDPDYTFRYISGTLTITPAALAVTANNESSTYGGALPTLAYSVSGLVNSDTPATVFTGTLATTATSSSNVGAYPITQGTLVANANYTLGFTPGTLTVNTASLAVTTNSESSTYGGTLPTLAYSVSGLVNGDTAGSVLSGTLATTATSSSNVGAYPITQGSLAADANYTLGFTAGTFTVNPAALSITANNASKVFGAPLPTFTATYTGFVNGDTPASLSPPAVFTTPGAAASPVGTYPLTVNGASDPNYTITFHPAVLTITQASTTVAFLSPSGVSVAGQPVTITVQVSAVSPGAGAPTGAVVFEIDGKVYDIAAVNPSTGLATYNNALIGVGPHGLTATYSGDFNFTGTQTTIAHQVDPATTQTTLTATDIRNRKGQLVSVILTSDVTAVPPGVGSPSGTITFFRNGSSLTSQSVNANGVNSLRLKPAQARGKSFFAMFGGDPSFYASTSPTMTIGTNGAVKTIAARPSFTFATARHAVASAAARLQAGALDFRWPAFVKHGRRMGR